MLLTSKRSYENTAVVLNKASRVFQPLEKEIDVSAMTGIKHVKIMMM